MQKNKKQRKRKAVGMMLTREQQYRKSLDLIFWREPDFVLLAQCEEHQRAMKIHKHDFCECAFAVRGHGLHRCEDHEPVPVERGCIMVIPQGGHHAYPKTSSDFSILNLMFDVTRLPPVLLELYTHPAYKQIFLRSASSYGKKDYPMIRLSDKVFSELEALLRPLADAGMEKGNHCYKLGLFMAVLSRLCAVWKIRPEEPVQALDIPRLTSYLEQNFQREVYLEELEQMSSMSRSTLQRHFRAALGVPPMIYLRNLRLRHAAELLVNTEFSLKEIADRSGFFRMPYFFKAFRDCYGVTPQEYRSSRRLTQKGRRKS